MRLYECTMHKYIWDDRNKHRENDVSRKLSIENKIFITGVHKKLDVSRNSNNDLKWQN